MGVCIEPLTIDPEGPPGGELPEPGHLLPGAHSD